MSETIKLGKLEVDLGELSHFLVDAKKHCYAGEGEEQRFPDGTKRLTFQQGDFYYTDEYSGWYQAPGTEIVRWKGQRIWQMAYAEGMLPDFIGDEKLTKRTFDFLKKALLQVTPENPFRGPERESICITFSSGDFGYRANTIGDISSFHGNEYILSSGIRVFSQNYIGGLVIPK